MAAHLDESYLVSSYNFSSTASTSSTPYPACYFTGLVHAGEKTSSSRKRRKIGVSTVQRSGVHLIDLSDQSPLASFTVSPSTLFTCPAVSVSHPAASEDVDNALALQESEPSTSYATSVAANRTRKTWAGVERDGRYELWSWTEQEKKDGTALQDASKASNSYDHRILCINAATIPGHVLVAFEDGKLILLDHDLKTVADIGLEGTQSALQIVTPLLPGAYQYIGLSSAPSNAVILPIVRRSNALPAQGESKRSSKKKEQQSLADEKEIPTTVTVDFLAVDSQRTVIKVVATCAMSNHRSDVIDVAVAININAIVALYHDGSLTTFKVSLPNGLGTISLDAAFADIRKATILSLVSQKSHRLLQDSLNLPEGRVLSLSSSRQPSSPFLLLASPRTSSRDTIALLLWDITYSVIVAELDFVVPASTTSVEQSGFDFTLSLLDEAENLAISVSPQVNSVDRNAARASIHAVAYHVPNQSTLASVLGKQAILAKYTASHSASLPATSLAHKGNTSTKQFTGVEVQALLAQLEDLLPLKAGAIRKIPEAESLYKRTTAERGFKLSTTASKRILALALPPSTTPDTHAPAWEIVSHLLSSKAVSDSSYGSEQGLTMRLLAGGDWQLVHSALRSLIDIRETALVAVLRAGIISTHGNVPEKAGQANRAGRPQLSVLLRLVMHYQYTSSAMRDALRTGLGSTDLLPLLEVLDEWLQEGDAAGQKQSDLGHTISFLTLIFDAHLVNILQDSSLHPLVRSLSAHLSNYLLYSAGLQGLRGPLTHMANIEKQNSAKAKARTLLMDKASANEKPDKTRGEQGGLLARAKAMEAEEERRKLKSENMVLGQYTVEEFKI